ncbi:MAG TPA: PAS domain-containing protein, partial [Thermoanaerobaculia bacterium]|nr:PAS domain-containing protein [Thermoanaerobaculia bacterium]
MTSLLSEPRQPAIAESPLAEPRSGLLDLAASLCQARFAVLRIDGRDATANDPTVPLDAEEVLAACALKRDEPFVVLDDKDLESVSGIGFYAAVRLDDGASGIHGTLSVLDKRARRLTKQEQQLLIKVAAQIVRSVRNEEILRASSEQQRWMQALVEQSPVAMYTVDGGRLSFVNARFASALGYTKEQVLALGSITEIIV